MIELLIDAHAALGGSGLLEASNSDSEGGGILAILALGPLAGIGFYTWTYRRYRNTDKRHVYEHETASEVRNPRTYDRKLKHIRGTDRKRIKGDNSKKATQRLGANTAIHHDA
ncbi:growth/differentiation factor [Pseudoclavibacter endophyticus]|uniref:Growth/differentiation factor n=1 Tax=Pseudoclavibacter endophyticus TaxID=1778590 RepID=A0A6H9WDJ2_9MICO|nr:growth/differentiation factor [Pseudoclavibacter endophyticus]KAB1648979.1 growth/differentiation factor [Pseudoclavibacter endophyticus]